MPMGERKRERKSLQALTLAARKSLGCPGEKARPPECQLG